MKYPSVKSMINDDGSILMPGKAVTWFEFLELSRLTNSKNGGWNSKSHWIKRGLNLLSPEIVNQWTINSLDKEALPNPRKEDFMLNRTDSIDRIGAMEKGAKHLADSGIDALNETQLNAVLYKNNHWLKNDWGNILSYEVPLAEESDGQLKIDLLGIGDDLLSIIELKQAASPSNTPLMALIESICYSIQAIKCKNYLPNEIRGFKRIRLILAAPKSYWNYWEAENHPEWSKINWAPQMTRLVADVENNLPQGFSLKLDMYSLHAESGKINLEQI